MGFVNTPFQRTRNPIFRSIDVGKRRVATKKAWTALEEERQSAHFLISMQDSTHEPRFHTSKTVSQMWVEKSEVSYDGSLPALPCTRSPCTPARPVPEGLSS